MTCLQRRTEKEKRQKERKVENKGKKEKEKRRVTGGREKESDLTRLVGPSHVCLFTKMP